MKSAILYPYGPLTSNGCCGMLHAKHSALTSAIYTLVSSWKHLFPFHFILYFDRIHTNDMIKASTINYFSIFHSCVPMLMRGLSEANLCSFAKPHNHKVIEPKWKRWTNEDFRMAINYSSLSVYINPLWITQCTFIIVLAHPSMNKNGAKGTCEWGFSLRYMKEYL